MGRTGGPGPNNTMTFAQQHRYDILASSLLLGGSIIATIVNYFVKQGFWRETLHHSALIALILYQPFYLWQLYCMSRGQRWAKILYLVLTGVGLIGFVLDYKRIALRDLTSTGATINFAFQNVLALVAAVLLILSLRKPTSELAERE
jgi:hypothetical protein